MYLKAWGGWSETGESRIFSSFEITSLDTETVKKQGKRQSMTPRLPMNLQSKAHLNTSYGAIEQELAGR